MANLIASASPGRRYIIEFLSRMGVLTVSKAIELFKLSSGMNKRLCLIQLGLAGLLIFTGAAAAAEDPFPGIADGVVRPSAGGETSEAYLPIRFASSHAANLLALPNGDLLCAWFSGTWENESDLAIVVSRLPKDSNRWTIPEVVAHKVGWAYQNPVLFYAPGGPLWLLHTSQAAGKGQFESRISYLTSDDFGVHWSEPKALFDQPGAFDRQRLLVLGKAWYLPMYFTPSFGITKNAEKNYPVVKISADRGKTWRTCNIPEANGLVQPDLIQLAPHSFLLFFRSRYADWVYKSTATDACHWTPPVVTQIPNNNASIQLDQLANGHLVIAFNNTQATSSRNGPASASRMPISIALSVDGGKTWPWVRDIETGQELPIAPVPEVIAGTRLTKKEAGEFRSHLKAFEYPSILQTPDGTIHVAYSFRRRTIKYVTFKEDWIKNGGTIGVFKGDRIPSPAASR